MDQIKKGRKSLRIVFTRAYNALDEALKSETENPEDLQDAFEALENKFSELSLIEEKAFSLMVQGDTSEEDLVHEIEMADEYKAKFVRVKNKVTRLLRTSWTTTAIQTSAGISMNAVGERRQKTYKLPKIELKKFNGDVKEWLQFWSQFKKIHEDIDIANEDKFQYLIQAMTPKSRAYELVQSFPPTGENYDKVISSLKNRFGREELQVEVYVREMLKLVLHKAMKPNEKTQLSTLYDRIESHLRALETLGVTTDKCAAMLFPLVESSLPEDLLRAWQRSSSGSLNAEVPKDRLTLLIDFLRAEVENEERISMAVRGFDLKSENDKVKRTKLRADTDKDIPSAASLLTTRVNKDITCIFCSAQHESANCEKARKMNIEERRETLREKNACFNCLKIGHACKKCRVNIKCAWCGKRHVILMCTEVTRKETATKEIEHNKKLTEESNLASISENPQVFLQTLRVKLRNNVTEYIVRTIIDTGSQRSYILKQTAEMMGYEPVSEQLITHSLFGGVKSDSQKHRCYTVHLSSLDGKYACNFKALDQDVICNSIPCIKNGSWNKELRDLSIRLTDIEDNEKNNEHIQILIGADIAEKLLTGHRQLLKCGLVAVETFLGWTIMGKVPNTGVHEDAAGIVLSMFIREENVSELWNLDTLGIKDPIETRSLKEHEKEVHEAFLKTVRLNENGRYEVRLPWLQSHPVINDNRDLAYKRLVAATKKLKNEGLFYEYNAVFEEWKAEGIIEEVPADEVDNWGHYLPHRHVVKEKSTTRIRPVFDASARDKNFPSLNQCLEKGPNFIELIVSLLLRFRKGNIGIISDIRKTFLQISIDVKDRDFLRFLWYDKEGNVIVLRHTRVVFGVSCSPFILGAIIDLHLDKIIESECLPRGSRENILKLSKSFYVDNCVTSVNSLTHLYEFISDAKAVMEKGCFDLRGWEYSGDDTHEDQAAVLGIIWHKKDDILTINVPILNDLYIEKTTKRSILSLTHRIFDPLGFACPAILFPKLLLQETWAQKISWDDEVTQDIKCRFYKWIGELQDLQKLKLPRCMIGNVDSNDQLTLHTFCDASQSAYAAVIFIRIEKQSGVEVQFVQAKSRVAPIKNVTIPRLELLAATIATSDSSTVLAWIHRECPWGTTFVWNRVQEIRKLSDPTHWRHVPGTLNPADLPSRGCSVRQLLSSNWWEGPQWLRSPVDEWPAQNFSFDDDEINKEKRKSYLTPVVASTEILLTTSKEESTEPNYRKVKFDFLDVHRFSDYQTILRVIAWVKRFINNSRRKKELRVKGEISVVELKESEVTLLRLIQSESFIDENDNRIRHLNTFKDDQSIIRLSTKITMRKDTKDFRYPIVLPADCYIVRLIIREKHEQLLHVGVQILMNKMREQFWILGGRRTIRSVIKQCVVCRRHDAKAIQVIPAPLPENRVRDAAVFEIVGIDLAGPVFLKGSQKAWIVLFTCAVYRALQLELVTSLSTVSFLEAFRRFVARRGRPTVVYSDNGKNFVGLNNLFSRVNWDEVAKVGTVQKIEWKFNPPTAAWWGGWWERLIGLTKRLLRRALKQSSLTYEEMSTVLCDCEAVINSRPITFMSDSTQDLVPLSPSMFLQEIREIGVPDCNQIEGQKLDKRFVYRQKIKDDLRRRFRVEYLGELVHHNNKKGEFQRIQVDDIVLVEDENKKRIEWPLARVKDVIIGKGNEVRVVRLIIASGELIRPVQKIYPLELTSDQNKRTVQKLINERSVSMIVRLITACSSSNKISEDSRQIPVEPTVVTRFGRNVKKPRRFL